MKVQNHKNNKENIFLGIVFSQICLFIIFLIFILIPLQVMVNNLDDVPKAIDAKLLFIYLINIFIFFCFIIFLNKKFKYFLNNKYIIFCLYYF